MRFLLDANLSPRIASWLSERGFSARHVQDLGLISALDEEIFDRAAAEGDVVVTADSDFTALLAARRTPTPSVILLRHVAELRPREQMELLVANMPAIVEELAAGAVVSLSPRRLAVRRLPIA